MLALTVVVAVTLGMVQGLTISEAVNGKTELRSFTDPEVRSLIRETNFLTQLLNCSPPAQRRVGVCASNVILREVISKYKGMLTTMYCIYVCKHLRAYIRVCVCFDSECVYTMKFTYAK